MIRNRGKCAQENMRFSSQRVTNSCLTVVVSCMIHYGIYLSNDPSKYSGIFSAVLFPGLFPKLLPCCALMGTNMAYEEKGTSPFSFDELVNIFGYLPPESLAKCSQVCRDWYQVSQVGSLWKRHCLQRWNFCHLGKLKPGG